MNDDESEKKSSDGKEKLKTAEKKKNASDKKAAEEKKQNRIWKRHQRIWTFLYHTVAFAFKKIFSYECLSICNVEPPYIVLSNHNCDLDPVLVAFSFPKQMYFVASEHVYRQGFISKVLHWCFEPIAKMKGTSDALTVIKMIKTLRAGKNVMLFPEGNRSFNGRQSKINEATGKLVKTSGASLITYRLNGGFFTNPRWGYGIRKGKMTGQIVNVYSGEQLKEMSPAEITECVKKDIFENAYEEQKKNPVRYKGKKLAEGMECAYSVCPECKTIGSVGTRNNSVFCRKCGCETEYSEYGYLGDEYKFKTLEEWDLWQEDFFADLYKTSADDEIIFSDENVILNSVNQDHDTIKIGTGKISLARNKIIFECGTDAENESGTESENEKKNVLCLDMNQITDMSIYGKANLVFTCNGVHYELTPQKKKLVNARKYLSMWKNFSEDKKLCEE